MTTTATEIRVNSFGFPIATCSRCTGTGMFGPASVEGGRCFACTGSGTVIKGKRAKVAWSEFCAARRAARESTVGSPTDPIAVGDLISVGRVWRRLLDVQIHDVVPYRPMGRRGVWDSASQSFATWEITSWPATLVFEVDGERVERLTDTNVLFRRANVTVDPAPFLDRI